VDHPIWGITVATLSLLRALARSSLRAHPVPTLLRPRAASFTVVVTLSLLHALARSSLCAHPVPTSLRPRAASFTASPECRFLWPLARSPLPRTRAVASSTSPACTVDSPMHRSSSRCRLAHVLSPPPPRPRAVPHNLY
jgi:hypothetical protein